MRVAGRSPNCSCTSTTRRSHEGIHATIQAFVLLRHLNTAILFHVLLLGLVTLQAALCAAQCSFWHALLQYSTLLHALHLLRPPLGQPGHAQRRRSLAPDAPALEPEEVALVVATLSAEQAESETGCGEIDMAEASAMSFFTAHCCCSWAFRASWVAMSWSIRRAPTAACAVSPLRWRPNH